MGKRSRKADALRKEHEIAIRVAELEDALADLKEDKAAAPGELRRVKNELREWRCVLRLGRPLDAAVIDDKTGEVVLDRSGRPLKVRVHNGFNIVNGELVPKEA